jgi:outer membrane receptor for ferrienterochelin and colicins
MTRLLLAVAMGLLLAGGAQAQTASVSGTVVDQSGAVVPGATVTLAGPGTHTPTTTGARGDYSFKNVAPGIYQIGVTLVGFSAATRDNIVVGPSNVEVPPVTLAVATLGETVVVSASKSDTALIDAPATMSVITGETLKSTPAQNYGDLLRGIPGVNVIQLSARDINVTSRQATSTLSNTQLVLLDGRSVYLDFFGLVLWDFLPNNTADIKQIEVIRGPASAVWGANALTGVVNIITKSPRETRGASATFSAGMFSRDAGSTTGKNPGAMFGANATYADAPNSIWSYRVSAGYFNSDPFPRPTGQIPIITDPRDPKSKVGGAFYPADASGTPGSGAYENQGTSQPKFDARVDQEIAGGRITYAGGVAGSSGTIYTGIGPFNIQKGSYIGYGKVNYAKGALKLNFFTNITNAQAPNLLLPDPATGQPLQLNFKTQTYDVEAGDAIAAGTHQVFTFGGNVRRNNFDITIAPTAENRTELGAYVQDQILLQNFDFAIGGRVDKFGNLSDPVFSPRLAATYKPRPDQGIRVSFNRAFRSPSVINNYLDTHIVLVENLSPLKALLPPPLQPLAVSNFPLVVRGVGSKLPIGSQVQPDLTEQSITAYEVAYTGTVLQRTTLGAAFYVNDTHNEINFVTLPFNLDPYTDANPPPGWRFPPGILTALAGAHVFLPRTAFTYENLGPIRQKGLELSIDQRFTRGVTAFANYSWQGDPTVLSSANPYPTAELVVPPHNRFNIGVNADGPRFLGAASVNYSDRAFWTDVLTPDYHGFTDAYTLVNASFGVKWMQGKVTTIVKVNNVLNDDIQQHVFGDILKRSALLEVRIAQQ